MRQPSVFLRYLGSQYHPHATDDIKSSDQPGPDDCPIMFDSLGSPTASGNEEPESASADYMNVFSAGINGSGCIDVGKYGARPIGSGGELIDLICSVYRIKTLTFSVQRQLDQCKSWSKISSNTARYCEAT